MLKNIKKILELFFILIFIFTLLVISYLSNIYFKNQPLEISLLTNNKISQVLDKDGKMVVSMELTKNNPVTYEELPDVFLNALISGEDARFYSHTGIDLQRIISSLVTNVTKSTTQGASTLTQQLIKNTLLDSSKTLDRKINEIIISLKLENKLTKEEILEAYCNNIMFDGLTLGVNNASLKFFNKSINYVNLPQAALLAGIVNAPSYYNPIRNPKNAKKRMDTILYLMKRHGYISDSELQAGLNTQISDMLVTNKDDETTYPYQAYLDIVYQEVKELTGLNPYTTPLIIETYLNTDIQKTIDDIQAEKTISFEDDNQQFALALIDNDTGALVASMGGRNYNGQLLFNRAVNMKNQPASTIKPLLSYALAIEHLNYNSKEVLIDEPYSYSNGNTINNVDLSYMGEILIEDAIGYSRNTTALMTLDKVIDEIGVNSVTQYLENINLLDIPREEFVPSYALGAFKYGVSPLDLASAYSMIANKGIYKQGFTVKRIINSSTNTVLYSHKNEAKRVLSTSSADILTSILENVVENNYYGLGSLKIKNAPLYIKSGTSSFDSALANSLNYPTNASKDLWIAGFSKQYSFAIWTGFDYPQKGNPNYFKAGSDSRKTIHKQILSIVLNKAINEEGGIELSDKVIGVNIVKGTKLLPDMYTPSNMIVKAYFKKEDIPTLTITPIELSTINNVDIFIYDNLIDLTFSDYSLLDIAKKEKSIYSNEKIYGSIEYVIEINDIKYVFDNYNCKIDLSLVNAFPLIAYTRYSNAKEITSNKYQIDLFELY